MQAQRRHWHLLIPFNRIPDSGLVNLMTESIQTCLHQARLVQFPRLQPRFGGSID